MAFRLIVGLLLIVSGCASGEAPRTEAMPEACTLTPVGGLDTRIVNEASGLEISARFPDRLYHINDSGDAGRFYVTALDGTNTRTVVVEFFEPRDAEDLTLGPCGSIDSTCLFIADIGDNLGVRDAVEIVVVEEQEVFGERVFPVDSVGVRYPDGAHDAESIAIHPNGDLFLLTKNADNVRRAAGPSSLYRLPLERRLNASGAIVTLEKVAELDLTALSGDPFSGSLPTAMDIRDDGTRLLVLTYVNAFEFFVDLARAGIGPAEGMEPGVDYRRIDLEELDQQESVAYRPAGGAFFYETERETALPVLPGSAPIVRVDCPD